MVYRGATYKIHQGNSARFTVEFYDLKGSQSVPKHANLSLTYVNTSNESQTDFVTLRPIGRFFTGIWSSTSSALGMVTWEAMTTPSTARAATGKLKIIQRLGG